MDSGENVYLTVSTRHIVVTRMSQPDVSSLRRFVRAYWSTVCFHYADHVRSSVTRHFFRVFWRPGRRPSQVVLWDDILSLLYLQETADFVAYVGKDERNGRRCYVFECGVGKAVEVISTIGQAFSARFEQVTSTPVTTISAR